MTSIMQEAMLACVGITKPTYIASQDLGLLNYREKTLEVSAQKMASRAFPMTWLCEMAKSVLGENGELLKDWHLVANPKTRATWTHSYGNKLSRLAQGMPGRAKGTDTIFFIPRHMVPKDRTRDVVRTHHMFDSTRKIRRTEQNEVSSRGGQSPLPI